MEMAFLNAEQLLRQARERPEALGEFYDRYEAAVLAYFMRRTNDAHQAVDLTAETFAEVVLQAHRGAQIDNATAWLFAVARSKLVDAHRRGRVDQRARRRLAIERVEAIDEQLERVESLGGDPRVAGLSH